MWGKRTVLPITAVILFAGTMNHAGRSLCHVVSNDARALYLWAEYKALTGDKEAAVQLFQRSLTHRNNQEAAKAANSQSVRQEHLAKCSETQDTAVTVF